MEGLIHQAPGLSRLMIRYWIQMMFVAAILCGSPQPTAAEPKALGRVVFKGGDWRVQVIQFTDGGTFCLADVRQKNSAFSIWTNGRGTVRLVFSIAGWHFGRAVADLRVRVDNRPMWNLDNAQFAGHTAVFELPQNRKSTGFLHQVMQGNHLALLNKKGALIKKWSLRGSNSALNALAECDAALGGAKLAPMPKSP